jgi:hypothetical protein
MDNNNCGACGAKCPANSVCRGNCCIQGKSTKVADSTGVVCSGNEWERQG